MKNILILAGGVSGEKEISKRSGENLYQALSKTSYKVTLLDPADSGFSYDSLKNFDVVYPILHGQKGEDGCIQGVLESLNIPYVGCGVMSSALTMDKSMTKKIFNQIGIPCPQGFVHNGDIEDTITKIKELSYPVFVKPVDEGSSLGTLILHNENDARTLLPDHLKKFPNSLVEEFISGREMTVGIIQKNDTIHILPILELKPKAEFYDFNTKYTPGMTEFILPAQIDESTLKQIHNHMHTIFNEFHLRDCVRVDLILTGKGPKYLEINTAPGMTNTSDIPAMLKADNIAITDFIQQLINNALRR